MNLPRTNNAAYRKMLKGAQKRNEDQKRNKIFWDDVEDMLKSSDIGNKEEFNSKAKIFLARHPDPFLKRTVTTLSDVYCTSASYTVI